MLIGIMRQISMENNSLLKYQPEILLKDDVLVRTNEEFDPEILLYQLIVFKEEFDKNEKYLVNILSCTNVCILYYKYNFSHLISFKKLFLVRNSLLK